MTNFSFDPPLAPRDGRSLKVVIVARISTEHQDERSLDDQTVLAKGYVTDRHQGPIDWKVIKSRGSGEFLDREELLELERLIESGAIDLVVAEDLARICRRTRAYDLCELAVDHKTRLIAINDHVDTAKPDWQMNAFFSVFRHESYNRDTAARIRRTQRNRFGGGGMVKIPLFCYVKPPGCKSDADLQKNMELEWVVTGLFDRLEQGWSFSRIADWLNANKVPVGPACRRKAWDRSMVRGVVFNPILKGVRVWNEKRSLRINKTGRRRSVKAPPEERIDRLVPHLAFIEPSRWDRQIAKLIEQGKRYSVPERRGNDPRKGRPKKRTRWPGQHVYCEICGSMFVYGGHGKMDHLMCSGAREYRCWNGVTFDGELAARRISEAIFGFVSDVPEFDSAILQLLKDESVQQQHSRHEKLHQVERELERMVREEQRLVEAIKQGGQLASLVDALKDLQAHRLLLVYDQQQLRKELPPPVQLPNVDEIRREVSRAFQELAIDSPEFADSMRMLIDRIVVFPVRLCDGGNPVLRGRFTVDLSQYLGEAHRLPSLTGQLRCDFVVDLFNMPQRAACREQVVAARARGIAERVIAGELGLTITAAQRASALHRKMQQLGMTDPYVPMTEPVADNNRYRRHRHERYRRPADGEDDAA